MFVDYEFFRPEVTTLYKYEHSEFYSNYIHQRNFDIPLYIIMCGFSFAPCLPGGGTCMQPKILPMSVSRSTCMFSM